MTQVIYGNYVIIPAMNKDVSLNLSRLIWALIIAQLAICLYMTGKQVLFNSSLKLWLNEDYFWHQKLQLMLGGDYEIAQQLASIPEDAAILLVRPGDLWFINYYIFPKRMYVYPLFAEGAITREADLKTVPEKWIKEKKIDFVLVYSSKEIKILKVGKDIVFK